MLADCDEHVREVEALMVSGLSRKEQAAFRRALLDSIHSLHGGLAGD